MASLRERLDVAKVLIAKQTGAAHSVEQRARRVRLLTGITLSVVGVGLVIARRMMLPKTGEREADGGWYFYLIFGLPLLIGGTLIFQSRYSPFVNGSFDSEDDS